MSVHPAAEHKRIDWPAGLKSTDVQASKTMTTSYPRYRMNSDKSWNLRKRRLKFSSSTRIEKPDANQAILPGPS